MKQNIELDIADALYAAIEQAAVEANLTLSEFVEGALSEYLAQHASKPTSDDIHP
jgi:hypothetical protein